MINADDRLVDNGNMFSYCSNNPVNQIDPDGHWPKWAGKAIKVAGIIAITAAVTVAIVLAAPAVATAVFTMAAVGGTTGAVAGLLAGAASGATYVVAGVYAAKGINKAVEVASGKNHLGNIIGKKNYSKVEAAVDALALVTLSFSSFTNKSIASSNLKNGSKMTTSKALSTAEDFLGDGYSSNGNGRFLSSDGLRQVRMGNSDILGYHGGGPHINFETLSPNPSKLGKMMVVENIHIYLDD